MKGYLKYSYALLNNNWVVGAAFFIISLHASEQTEFLNPFIDAANGWINSYQNLLGNALIIVCSIILSVWIIKNIISWKTLSFHNEKWPLSFYPYLKILNWFNSKDKQMYELLQVLDNFKTLNGKSAYYLMHKSYGASSSIDEKPPLVIYKLPAREHLSLSDFQDLKLLKEFINQGIKVYIIIIDVPYLDSQPLNVNTEKTCEFTMNIIQNILGKSVRSFRLSKVLFSKSFDHFSRFLFDKYIPFYANRLDTNLFSHDTKGDTPQILKISYLVFALLLRSISNIDIKKYTVYVVQWNRRLFKWDEFKDFIENELSELRISGLIVGEDFQSYKNKKMRTAISQYPDYSFTMTESRESVARKILTYDNDEMGFNWIIPNDYLDFVSLNVFGYNLKAELNNDDTSLRKLESFYKSFNMKNGENSGCNFEDIDRDSLIRRYLFHKEYCRIQKKILS